MKKLILLLLTAILTPQLVFAAWWNPFSWFSDFDKVEQASEDSNASKSSLEFLNTTTFYIKYDNSRVRSCPSTSCEILGYYKQNDHLIFDGKLKLNELPDWVVVSEVDGYINKSVLSGTRVGESFKTTADNTQTENNLASSGDVGEFIDTLISQQESDLLYIGEHYSTHIDYYDNWASEGRKVMGEILEDEDNAYLKTNWKYIYDLLDYVIDVGDVMRSGSELDSDLSIQSLLKSVNERYSYLKKLRSEIPQSYPSQDAEDAALLRLIESNTAYRGDLIERTYQGGQMYFDVVKNAMNKIEETIEEVDDYLEEQRYEDMVVDRTVYRSIAVPQIQMPKTTYCTMSGGLGGIYNIVCN